MFTRRDICTEIWDTSDTKICVKPVLKQAVVPLLKVEMSENRVNFVLIAVQYKIQKVAANILPYKK